MFQRRDALTLRRKAKEFFWPSMGWKRTYRYVQFRLIRLSDTTHKIALGLAFGVSVSFTPLLGTHFIQAGILAFLFRANLLSAIIGTFIGNPWTFPFIWWASIAFGSFLFNMIGLPAETALPDNVDFSVLWEIIKNEPMRIFIPWLLGGYLLAFASIPVAYFGFYRLVGTAKKARSKARLRRVHKLAMEMTGQKK